MNLINQLILEVINTALSTPQYPSVLRNSHEIAQYISSLSSTYVDTEMMEEYFSGYEGILKTVPITSLVQGDVNSNIRVASKEKKYAKMDPNTIPPLVVMDGVIQDGNHRFRVALQQGVNEIKIYDLV